MSEAGAPGGAILIAAASGRALASAARRAGYSPLVADFFDDSDTRACAAATRRAGDPDSGFDATLIAALDGLAKARAPVGLIYGAGFEDRAGLLGEIARRWPLLGNAPDVVRRTKDPAALAALCKSLGVPHPEISRAAPPDAAGWLVKSVGGAGGSHVAPAGAWRGSDEKIYFQRVAPGEPVSLLCLCDGAAMRALGASRQWAAPAPDEPFRYGGCVRPAGISPDLERRLAEAAGALAAALALVGLTSFDFLVAGDAFALVEINPRPGATLDIFEDRDGRLFQAHIDACRGHLSDRALEWAGAAAAGVAHARRAIAAMPALDWPDWASDSPRPRTALRLNDPLCTITACAADPAEARALVAARTAALLDSIDAKQGSYQFTRLRKAPDAGS